MKNRRKNISHDNTSRSYFYTIIPPNMKQILSKNYADKQHTITDSIFYYFILFILLFYSNGGRQISPMTRAHSDITKNHDVMTKIKKEIKAFFLYIFYCSNNCNIDFFVKKTENCACTRKKLLFFHRKYKVSVIIIWENEIKQPSCK